MRGESAGWETCATAGQETGATLLLVHSQTVRDLASATVYRGTCARIQRISSLPAAKLSYGSASFRPSVYSL